MAEGNYVKLTPDQALQNITPGELNQPIDIARINARRCPECQQTLPATYQPPADEDWSTGVCSCAEDTESCVTGLFCPCVLFGRNVENLVSDVSERSACVGHLICIEGGLTVAAVTAALNGIDPQTSCLIFEGLFFAWWMCGIYTGLVRQSLQRKYHLKDSPCDPCMVHCYMHWCAICQEHREMKARLSYEFADVETVIDPPPAQEMTVVALAKDQPSSSSSSNKDSSTSSIVVAK
ncbi:cell number regulator 6-like [Impatiens glandulifera]|uniref:cell number regulator 6-like n=1 Tax=Impatiens glandulifera TaxID=253017 RepID=UPI001FB17FE5|nr:cell number regulator 6-like [Impatiens glandulifera]